MDTITGGRTSSGIYWRSFTHRPHQDEGFRVHFSFGGGKNERDAVRIASSIIEQGEIDWLFTQGQGWVFDATKFRAWVNTGSDDFTEFLANIEWMEGAIPVSPTVEQEVTKQGKLRTKVDFNIFKEDYAMTSKAKIFLSHKGADKEELVRGYFDTLKLLGFDPWLDTEDMPGGTKLHRGIRQGFTDSCAAVFFITPNFKDEAYLAKEIDYALEEEQEKGERFKILALVFQDEEGNTGEVPKLLKSYVYKAPKNDLEALREIVRSLPIQLGASDWKPGI